ncbi:hypothetical protein J0667_21295 [Methylomonas sp. WH-1]|uniref:hypothetical protein n=1 Tax=unclassified Methylomonas TaxID=2608980 RepID=UPI0010565BE7|nr:MULTISPECIES: hypothetical protein [unclassified Methylomonas]
MHERESANSDNRLVRAETPNGVSEYRTTPWGGASPSTPIKAKPAFNTTARACRCIRVQVQKIRRLLIMNAKKFCFNENINELEIDPRYISEGVSFAEQNNYTAIRILELNEQN